MQSLKAAASVHLAEHGMWSACLIIRLVWDLFLTQYLLNSVYISAKTERAMLSLAEFSAYRSIFPENKIFVFKMRYLS